MKSNSPAVPSPALREALALHEQGRLQEAESRYGRILVREPNNVVARFYLGLAKLQRGDLAAGIAALKQTLKLDPAHADAHWNLGQAYSLQGRHAEALPHFQQLLALLPDMAEAHLYAGMALASLGRQAEALPHLEQAATLRPNMAEARHNLGSALADLGRHAEAATAFEHALALRPGFAEAHNGLGNALDKLGRLDAACGQFKQAIVLKPDFTEAYLGWGRVLYELGQHEAALAAFDQARQRQPENADAYFGLGRSLRALNRHEQARADLERAIALFPDHPGALNELGSELSVWGRYGEGLAHLEHAVAAAPGCHVFWGSLLFSLHYHPDLSAAEVAARHRSWGERVESGLGIAPPVHDNPADPERPLRLGFVSADFRSHPVGYFMVDLLAAFDPGRIRCYAYANQIHHDGLTERIRPQFECWREVAWLSDEALAEQIRTDGIDILVDLSGHTRDNRLPVFARKPAPVQVSYLGYFDSMGLAAMDYILGNRWLLPEAEAGLYTERLWRLPDAHLCFSPADIGVEVGPLPAEGEGRITFGCFNKIEKVNDRVIACWSRILHAVPGSRLFLKSKPLGDAAVAATVHARFGVYGIGEDRLLLEGKSPHREYFQSYNRVDVALDPYPYNGGTTTVDALWMGVPVLALRGDRYVAHMSESILQSVNMTDWVAENEEDYIAKAAAFAGDLPALTKTRAGLRQRLLDSPICDAPGFARNLEAAFRGMWRVWCERQAK